MQYEHLAHHFEPVNFPTDIVQTALHEVGIELKIRQILQDDNSNPHRSISKPEVVAILSCQTSPLFCSEIVILAARRRFRDISLASYCWILTNIPRCQTIVAELTQEKVVLNVQNQLLYNQSCPERKQST